jgi:hypothetical protein
MECRKAIEHADTMPIRPSRQAIDRHPTDVIRLSGQTSAVPCAHLQYPSRMQQPSRIGMSSIVVGHHVDAHQPTHGHDVSRR